MKIRVREPAMVTDILWPVTTNINKARLRPANLMGNILDSLVTVLTTCVTFNIFGNGSHKFIINVALLI